MAKFTKAATPQVEALPGVTPLGLKKGKAAPKFEDVPMTAEELKAVPPYIRKEVAADPKAQKAMKQAQANDKAKGLPKGKEEMRAHATKAMEEKFGKDYNAPKAPYMGKSKTSVPADKPAKALPDDAGAKIATLKKENPHKPDSNRAKAFDAAVNAKTVGEYLKQGAHCKYKYLKVWEKDKLIKVG